MLLKIKTVTSGHCVVFLTAASRFLTAAGRVGNVLAAASRFGFFLTTVSRFETALTTAGRFLTSIRSVEKRQVTASLLKYQPAAADRFLISKRM